GRLMTRKPWQLIWLMAAATSRAVHRSVRRHHYRRRFHRTKRALAQDAPSRGRRWSRRTATRAGRRTKCRGFRPRARLDSDYLSRPGQASPCYSGCSSQRSPTGQLNRGIDGVFQIVRVVGRGLVSIAEVHAIVVGAQLAQSEPEMARDRFGFLERHGFVYRHRETVAVELATKRRS